MSLCRATRSFPISRHMNRAGYSVVLRAKCTLTRMIPMRNAMPKRGMCIVARQSVPTRIVMIIPAITSISMDRPEFLQMTIQSDRAGGPRTAALLARMLQFGDSMFPIGGFSFSCGLESAIQKGIVVNTKTLAAYARTAVEQAARGDGIALIAAHNAASAADFDALVQIDSVVFARKLSEEMRTMTVRMGKKFTEIGLQVIDLPFLRRWCECIEAGTTPGCYPISLAVNFAVQNLSAREAFVVHQYGVAAMILGASL